MTLSSVHLLNPVSFSRQVETSTSWSELGIQESGVGGAGYRGTFVLRPRWVLAGRIRDRDHTRWRCLTRSLVFAANWEITGTDFQSRDSLNREQQSPFIGDWDGHSEGNLVYRPHFPYLFFYAWTLGLLWPPSS